MIRFAALLSVAPLLAAAAAPDFSREVRPILSQHCFKCHGPDKQKSGLRLDERASATKPAESGETSIVAGKPDASELLRRVTSHDEDDVMPPRGGTNKPLTPPQIATLRAWIADGAEFRAHWAYVKPARPETPAISDFRFQISDVGMRNPIDAFIRKKLADEKLAPSPEAEPAAILRRLSLDLIGLPPTPEEVATFTRSAIESAVDRLLASPRFGEKWARHWLDLARYGDSAGYQHDDDMPLWLFRDWVVRAFNDGMPFDQFTIEQIAGDLLPGATLEQRIATGFHRGATVTLGADQNVDELRAQLVWDRVNTVGTAWLATSLECAQCHTHKFDPFPQTDYYRLFAYFNRTVPELTKEAGSHYFITGGILEMPVDAARQARARHLQEEMESEVARMIAVPVDLSGLGAAPLRRIFTGPDASRSPERVFYYLTEELKGDGPPPLREHIRRLRALGRELLDARPPRALVLEEDAHPPATRVLLRGNVRTPGDAVTPGTPAALHPLPADAPPNRLGLARWLVSRENPLTARVMVNRWWAEIFGTGLVTTPEDFGLQGEAPSHPELLDWLAVEFMESGWNVKHVLKLIVTSETYRQSSRIRDSADPQNRLLSRGPRYRLDAETLRDNALAIAGLLDCTPGGPPVPATAAPWRRGIYVRQQRGEPYATFASFDAPDRFACTARRARTNTPLQALALLNEPVFAEAADALGRRVARELPDADFEARLSRMFRLCTARLPAEDERSTLRKLFDKTQREGATADDAWRLLANVLLNLDETITKE